MGLSGQCDYEGGIMIKSCVEEGVQNLLVFQQRDRAMAKIAGISEYGRGRFDIRLVSVEDTLPPVIEDTSLYLPSDLEADLVLDYLVHPDLSYDLAEICRIKGIPVIASGKKIRNNWVYTPPICCALPRRANVGPYGERFGYPEFFLTVSRGCIEDVKVVRGAPCGASWKAAEKITGLPLEEALVRIGLETQFFCSADPAGWDPLWGKSPVHLAADIHFNALKKALDNLQKKELA